MSSSIQRSTKYVPKFCEACGLTQKELHQQLGQIHDPSDPEKCCLRGPEYIPDKNIRERILQYNLKHPPPKNQHTASKVSYADPLETPPTTATLPTPPQCNSSISNCDIEAEIDQIEVSTSTPHEPVIKSLRTVSVGSTDKDIINSLTKYIEELPSDKLIAPTIHHPKVSAVSNTTTSDPSSSDIFFDAQSTASQICSEENTNSPVPPSLFYQYEK